MSLSPLFFYFFAGLATVSALFVVFKKNPITSAFSLILVFFSFAGIYAMLEAHLLAALQVFVYAGAVIVLFLFVIMLLNSDKPSFDLIKSHSFLKVLVGFFIAALFFIFLNSFQKNNYLNTSVIDQTRQFTTEKIETLGGNTQVISELMFSEYILPFELTSVLLLAAIVASVALIKRKPSMNKGK